MVVEKTANWIINVVLIIAVLVIFWILWSALSKRTDVETYGRGATKQENSSTFTIHEYPLSFPCGKFVTYDPTPREKKK